MTFLASIKLGKIVWKENERFTSKIVFCFYFDKIR